MVAKAPILKLKISIVGASPPIWRRILVPGWSTLGELHLAIQEIFDWKGEHLHFFRQGEREFEAPDSWDATEPTEEDAVLLSSLLSKKGNTLNYIYDFGDNWDHRVVLEERLPVDPDLTYPKYLEARMAAPPEDFGGIERYNAAVEANKRAAERDNEGPGESPADESLDLDADPDPQEGPALGESEQEASTSPRDGPRSRTGTKPKPRTRSSQPRKKKKKRRR
jgi:hypothetical protein